MENNATDRIRTIATAAGSVITENVPADALAGRCSGRKRSVDAERSETALSPARAPTLHLLLIYKFQK